MVVDFPAPFAPIYPTISPSFISKLISSTAFFIVYSVEKNDLKAPLKRGH